MVDVVMGVQVLERVERDIRQGAPLDSTFQLELRFPSTQNMSTYGYRCLETICCIGLPLIIHFLPCVDNDLNLIDLVLTGLDRPGSECSFSLGGCFCVCLKISCGVNLTSRTLKGSMLTMGLPVILGPISFPIAEIADVLVVPIISSLVLISFSNQSSCAALPAAAVVCFLESTCTSLSSCSSCLIDWATLATNNL